MPSRARAHEILNQTRAEDRVQRIVTLGLVILIVANIVAVVLETVPGIQARWGAAFRAFDRFSIAVFTAEYLLRVWAAAEEAREGGSTLRARLRWMMTPGAIIDLAAVLPSWLGSLVGLDLRALRALRLLRLLKLMRYSAALNLLADVIARERHALLACLFILGMLIVVAASGAWLAESEAQPDKFGSIPAAMWWAVVTLTTVGYGDSYPVTPLGQLFGALILVMGVGMAALPAGILATGFADHLSQRRRELEDRYFHALADGIIDESEERALELLRREYGLTRERARQIRARAKQVRERRVLCPHCGKPLPVGQLAPY